MPMKDKQLRSKEVIPRLIIDSNNTNPFRCLFDGKFPHTSCISYTSFAQLKNYLIDKLIICRRAIRLRIKNGNHININGTHTPPLSKLTRQFSPNQSIAIGSMSARRAFQTTLDITRNYRHFNLNNRRLIKVNKKSFRMDRIFTIQPTLLNHPTNHNYFILSNLSSEINSETLPLIARSHPLFLEHPTLAENNTNISKSASQNNLADFSQPSAPPHKSQSPAPSPPARGHKPSLLA